MQYNRDKRSVSPALLLLLILGIAVLVGAATFLIFYVVVSNHAVSGSTGTATPGPAASVPAGSGGPCTPSSPYGFTTIHADSPLVSVYRQLDVCWVRYQYHWSKIETSPGVYDWSQVDAAVAAMSAANIHVDFAIQYAPPWDLTQVCSANGQHFLPGPAQMQTFATVLATRYDGKHGHGYISSYEIGNEEYDSYYVAGMGNNQPCRSASYYGPVLKAGYQAIKAASPQALVGMFGLWWHNEPHIQDFMTYLFANGYGPYMDYMNFHYYHSGGDPSSSNGDDPSFNQEWQTMHTIADHYGFGNKPIWVTEVGWPTTSGALPGSDTVSPQTQAQYMQYVLDESAKSGVVQRVFWFTINYGHQRDSIYPPTGPLPAFYTMQAMVRTRPQWVP
jgi:hypothetical protein